MDGNFFDDDGEHVPVIDPPDRPMSDDDGLQLPSAIATLDSAINALAVEDLSHLDPTFDHPPVPHADFGCRDACCRGGLAKRPGRKSRFLRPAP